MENKSDGKSSSKGLPTNIGTLPARLQNRIISGADHESKHAVGKGKNKFRNNFFDKVEYVIVL